MTASQVLALLERHGVTLAADGEVLRLRAPAAPPAELLDLARQHKPGLLALLTGERPQPYLDAHGDLVVPFDADPALQWWRGGRSVLGTLDALGADPETRRRYENLH